MSDEFDDLPAVPPKSPELSDLVEFARSDLPNDEQWAALTAQLTHVWGGATTPESLDAAPEPPAGHVSPTSGAATGGAKVAASASAALPGVAKVAGVAALAGALASGVWLGSRPAAVDVVETPPPGASWVAVPNAAPTVVMPPVAAVSATSPVAAASAAAATMAPRAPSTAASKGSVSPSELQLLQEAREQLDKNPQRSLALCRQHQRLYPHGQLAQEREVLLIEALTRLNRDKEASKRRTEFGKTFPDSPHQSRVKQGTE